MVSLLSRMPPITSTRDHDVAADATTVFVSFRLNEKKWGMQSEPLRGKALERIDETEKRMCLAAAKTAVLLLLGADIAGSHPGDIKLTEEQKLTFGKTISEWRKVQ